jgi:arylsulfatase A-like enzyme
MGLAVARLLAEIRPSVASLIPIARTAVETTISRDREGRQLLLRRGKLELSSALFLTLCKRYRPRLAMFGSFYIDMTEHSCWRHFEPDKFPDRPANSRLRNAIERAYECTDAALGRVLNGMPRNTLVAFVSEHGMAAEVPANEVGQRRFSIRAGPVKALAELPDDVTASPIARWIAFRHHRGERYSDELVRRLSEITVVESGVPLFQVYRSASAEVVIKFNLHTHVDVYRRVALEELSIRRGDRVVGFTELARYSGELRSGMHDGEAVFILSGPRIRPSGEITGASVLDVVPTILAASGLRVPDTLDGRALDVVV